MSDCIYNLPQYLKVHAATLGSVCGQGNYSRVPGNGVGLKASEGCFIAVCGSNSGAKDVVEAVVAYDLSVQIYQSSLGRYA